MRRRESLSHCTAHRPLRDVAACVGAAGESSLTGDREGGGAGGSTAAVRLLAEASLSFPLDIKMLL